MQGQQTAHVIQDRRGVGSLCAGRGTPTERHATRHLPANPPSGASQRHLAKILLAPLPVPHQPLDRFVRSDPEGNTSTNGRTEDTEHPRWIGSAVSPM